MSVLTWTLVALIGGAGSVLRFLVDKTVVGRFGRALPWSAQWACPQS